MSGGWGRGVVDYNYRFVCVVIVVSVYLNSILVVCFFMTGILHK